MKGAEYNKQKSLFHPLVRWAGRARRAAHLVIAGESKREGRLSLECGVALADQCSTIISRFRPTLAPEVVPNAAK